METKKCTCCGRELPLSEFYKKKLKSGNYSYRSRCKECYKNEGKERHTKICEHCGKEFKTREKHQRFCSNKCNGEYRNKQITVICSNCNKEFKVSQYKYEEFIKGNHTSICCSNECRYEYYGKTHKKENHWRYDKTITEEMREEGYYEHTCKKCGKIFRSNNMIQDFCSHSCATVGKNNPKYNSNLTDEEREKGRNIEGYKEWRKQVYERDNYTCQCCGEKGHGNLVAHHKNGYNWDKEHRTDVDNGVTLCEDCHKEFHEIYGKGNNTEEQYIEFLTNKHLRDVV